MNEWTAGRSASGSTLGTHAARASLHIWNGISKRPVNPVSSLFSDCVIHWLPCSLHFELSCIFSQPSAVDEVLSQVYTINQNTTHILCMLIQLYSIYIVSDLLYVKTELTWPVIVILHSLLMWVCFKTVAVFSQKILQDLIESGKCFVACSPTFVYSVAALHLLPYAAPSIWSPELVLKAKPSSDCILCSTASLHCTPVHQSMLLSIWQRMKHSGCSAIQRDILKALYSMPSTPMHCHTLSQCNTTWCNDLHC